MTSEEKKAVLLLNSIIFHYHGLDEDEQQLLDETAQKFDAQEELKWATDFIAEDYYTAFERASTYLKNIMMSLDTPKRMKYLQLAWEANHQKGQSSIME